jgi:hypothetical protein
MSHYLPDTEQCHILHYLCISLMYIKCEVGMPHYYTLVCYKDNLIGGIAQQQVSNVAALPHI